MHKILLEKKAKTSLEHQRRMNPVMKEVIRKEVLKWLNAGFIYVISNSHWVSPVHVVPKKGGFTVIRNEKNELIPTRIVTGWKVCIDYRKLNTTCHTPIPGPTRLADPNRVRGARPYTGTLCLIFFLFFLKTELVPVVMAHIIT